MGMLRICSTDGCQVKTLGEHCLLHEPPRVEVLPPPRVPLAAAAGVASRDRVPVTAA
jgi:hypothetical protein